MATRLSQVLDDHLAEVKDGILRRVLAKVEVRGECWFWMGNRTRNGYALIHIGYTALTGHRAIYEFFMGEIPEGLTLDHLCRNRACVNPAHLEPVTHAENVARSGPATKAECVRGHSLLDPENTYLNIRGRRVCRACHRIRNAEVRERRKRRKEAAA